jgi:hypothetical protein
MDDPMKEASPKPSQDQEVWEQGWDGHRRLQLERLAHLPLYQKLLWLEEAHRLVLHMQSKHKTSS